MSEGRLVILSPHFDDAALSAWSALRAGRDVVVVNVCSGLPPGGSVTTWDSITGATDSRERVEQRREEDRRALALAGAGEPVSLDFLDAQYRGEPIDAAELEAAIRDAVAGADEVWAPAGIGRHVDHVQVRDAALSLTGPRLSLYAELPSAVKFGWPAWVSGAAPDPYLRPDADWAACLPSNRKLEPVVHELSDEAAREKLRVLRTYRTQFSALSAGILDVLAAPAVLTRELSWRVLA